MKKRERRELELMAKRLEPGFARVRDAMLRSGFTTEQICRHLKPLRIRPAPERPWYYS